MIFNEIPTEVIVDEIMIRKPEEWLATKR